MYGFVDSSELGLNELAVFRAGILSGVIDIDSNIDIVVIFRCIERSQIALFLALTVKSRVRWVVCPFFALPLSHTGQSVGYKASFNKAVAALRSADLAPLEAL